MGVKSAYLFLYNLSLGVTWSWILYLVINHAKETGFNRPALKKIWAHTELPLKVAQTAAVLEVVHSLVGLVRAPVMTTVAQVSSRLYLVWGILNLVPAVATRDLNILTLHPALEAATASLKLPFAPALSLGTMLLAWCLSEVIRYSFFAAQELGLSPYVLLWLRYTAFYVLYPLGVSSELSLTYLALPSIQKGKLLTVELPNRFNFAFDYYIASIGIMFFYLPGFYTLFSHMIRQRKKKLREARGGARGDHGGRKKRE